MFCCLNVLVTAFGLYHDGEVGGCVIAGDVANVAKELLRSMMFCMLMISVLLFCLPGWQLLFEEQMNIPAMEKKHWLLLFNERTETNSHQSFIDSNTRI